MGQHFIKDKIPFYVGLFWSEFESKVGQAKSPKEFIIKKVEHSFANDFVQAHHYLHRKLYIARNVSYGLFYHDWCVGVCIFGYPVWHEYPGIVPPNDIAESPELLRLATMGGLPKNTESYFVGKCLKNLKEDWVNETGRKPKCVTSFCDEAMGFDGALYKALNFQFHRRTKGRPSNPGGAHGKWGRNEYKQDAIKVLYVFWFSRPTH